MDQKWLETCVQAGEFLYGIYPAAVLKKMYERRAPITADEVRAGVERSNAILMEYMEGSLLEPGEGAYGGTEGFLYPTLVDGEMREMMEQADREGNPYADIHLREEVHLDLMSEQSDVDFYIPREQEIVELTTYGYIRTPAMTALEEHARKLNADPSFVTAMWPQISTDHMDPMEAIQYVIGQLSCGSNISSMDDLNASTRFVTEYINSVNLRARRGWAPTELRRRSGPMRMPTTIVPGSVHAAKMLKEIEPKLQDMGLQVDFDAGMGKFVSIGPYGEKKIIKVGRNDPCPCGSGKKYKRCHGR